ncbi:unnamed protein product [Moneuplotes crassus]|uniref:UBC core domain-containing protein n=1 Tax=Euplotes crassus TaxID=5936 RepID=A0AAD1UBK6_EUPCR|nr:unnamed protein product [Moneuplotes crassus]
MSPRISRDIEEILYAYGETADRAKYSTRSSQFRKIDVYAQEPYKKEFEVENPDLARKPSMSSSLNWLNKDNQGEVEMDCDGYAPTSPFLKLQRNIIVPLAIIKSENGMKAAYHWNIFIPPDYPFKPPHVYSLDSISHEDIDPFGRLLIYALEEGWSPCLTLSSVICILELFICGTLEDKEPRDNLQLDSNYFSNTNSKGYELERIQKKKKCPFYKRRRYESMEKDDTAQESSYESPQNVKSKKRVKKGTSSLENLLISNSSRKTRLSDKM